MEYQTNDKFCFDIVTFAQVNLLVGDSGTGKTRFLNSLFNFFTQLVSDKVLFNGKWDVDFESNRIIYNYKLYVTPSVKTPREKMIVSETLTKNEIALFRRENGTITWNDMIMPKLSSDKTCFALLEDDEIGALYADIKKIIARRFYGDELNKNFQLGTVVSNAPNNPVPPHIKTIENLAVEPIDFHNKMYILQQISPNNYKKTVDFIRSAFPFIIDASVQNLVKVMPNFQGALNTHVFCIKEYNIDKWIVCNNISSGMQKLFLLILDTILLQNGGILLIDEYENSLGVSAINFFPDLIASASQDCQFIITSHHPYIINRIPIESWKIFHRDGMNVHITSGIDLKEKYSRSRQDHFIQLINDPLYNGGIQ
ncbi:AAA family ATPase [Treponema endosymbiont of Eucomonympha sp.]|uniref:AAA family ATPase n=1 Tax=Treponema endosymbiont of Eucomonympha sp. TaxID=1580831 RepID=UPI0016504869|nr:AAA family ATPase [Treponema endosymbiont of Eucomonympha sp.]